MQIVFSNEFKKDYKKIRNEATRIKIIKALKALAEMPGKGKMLGNVLHGKRSIRFKPYRLIYELRQNELIVLCFDHRKNVYKDI